MNDPTAALRLWRWFSDRRAERKFWAWHLTASTDVDWKGALREAKGERDV